MDEITPQQAPASKLSKEQRSEVMRQAATRRWAKAKKEKAKAAKVAEKPALKVAARPVAKAAGKSRSSAPREFSSALRTAEKRLAAAILERAKAAATYAVVSAEIPSLQRLIIALKNPLGVLPEYGMTGTYGVPAMPTLEQIVGDQPLDYVNPPRRDIPIQQFPAIPTPQQLHPANTMATTARGGGGAIGGVLDEEADADEDKFLKESEVAGGTWH